MVAYCYILFPGLIVCPRNPRVPTAKTHFDICSYHFHASYVIENRDRQLKSRRYYACSHAYIFVFSKSQKHHSANIVFTLIHLYKRHVYEFFSFFAHFMSLRTHECNSTSSNIFFFSFTAVLEEIKSDEIYDRLKFLLCPFFMITLYHMASCCNGRRTDAAVY